MLILVSLIHAGLFAQILLRMTGQADPAGFRLFLLFLVAAIPSPAVNLLVWISGRWLVVIAANLVGAAAVFLYLRTLSAEAAAMAAQAAIVFFALGLPLSACLLGWRRWTRSRRSP